MVHPASRTAKLVAWLAVPIISGCASFPPKIYSPERDKQGQEVQKAWKAVDLAGQIDAPRKHIKALLDEQQVVEEEIWTAYRNARANQMAHQWTLGDFKKTVDTRFADLVGRDVTAEQIQKHKRDVEFATRNLKNQAVTLAIAGLPSPNCSALVSDEGLNAAIKAATDKSAEAGQVADEVLRNSAEHCRVIANIGKAGGELGQAQAKLTMDREALSADKAAAAALKADYNEEKTKYDQAALTLLGDPNNADTAKSVSAAIARLGKLVNRVKEAQDAFSIQFLSEERLSSLDSFLTTYKDVAAGKGTKDGNKVAIALALFPDIRAKTRVALNDLEKPNLVPLAILKNLELARLEAANREVELRVQIVAEREAQVAALTAQVTAITAAREAFNDKTLAETAMLGKRMQLVMVQTDDKGLDSRFLLWRATARYLDAEGRLRADVGKSYYRLSALEHEKVLTLAEGRINQWRSLIDPSVDVMASYGAAGLKSSDVTAFINSIMLLAIAVGVN